MEQVISTGEPAEVSALLKRMDEPSAVIRQLTGCYGGRRRRAETNQQFFDWEQDLDNNGLFRMTVPLLHAAYTGNTSMFSTVYLAIRANLRPQQVSHDQRFVGGCWYVESPTDHAYVVLLFCPKLVSRSRRVPGQTQ